jgi:hypothetical protein
MDATIEQGSPAWLEQRKYKFTSSNIYKLMSEPRAKADKEAGNLSDTAMTYIYEKAAEELGGYIPEAGGHAIEWGETYEPLAKDWYERLMMAKIIETGFVQVNEFYGGSPDAKVVLRGIALIETEGALEIKCPHNSRIHIEHSLIDSADRFKSDFPDKYWQCMSHMDTLNVGFCDFVSFDPRIDSQLGFFCFRLIRNEDDIKRAVVVKNEIVALLRSRL